MVTATAGARFAAARMSDCARHGESPWWAPAQARRRDALPGRRAGSRAPSRRRQRSFHARVELQHRGAFLAREAVLLRRKRAVLDLVVVAGDGVADEHAQ